MTARFGLGALVIAIALSLLSGTLLGFSVGWAVRPIPATDTNSSSLATWEPEDYITFVAEMYASDSNLSRARERLDRLNDPSIEDRVALLAQTYASQNSVAAARVARLAIALGAQSDTLLLIAVTPTPTVWPIATNTATPLPTPTPSPLPMSTATVKASATRAPSHPTVTRVPAPLVSTIWLPSFPSEWPGGAYVQPVTVAPGQRYWRLAKALYCDDRDQRNNCPNLPGGDTGTNIYIMLVDAQGNRINGPLIVTKDDGSVAEVGDIGPEKTPDDQCQCNYTYLANHWPIQIGGAPSDTIGGLGLYSVRMGIRQAHTRYYLTFQLTVR